MNTWVIIPCFNEADRLLVQEVRVLAANDIHVLLVDDGSTDDTWELISELAEIELIHALRLEQNGGKAEAVRLGFNRALDFQPETIGFLDADFSTPAAEMIRLLNVFEISDVSVVLASRWLHLGAQIERSALRHYLSRVFSTFASLLIALPVYDTQCGAKFFQATQALRTSMSYPFLSKWAFDVELLGRLLQYGTLEANILEVPVKTWADKAGSKMSPIQMIAAVFDLWRIRKSLRLRPAAAPEE